MNQKTNRGAMTFLAVLLIAPVLAGCLGDDEVDTGTGPKVSEGVTIDADPNVKTTGTGGELRNATGTDKDLPKAHFHHYWGERESVVIFDGIVRFKNMDMRYASQYKSLVYADFDLETDGDDVEQAEGGSNSMDVDPAPNGHADTVFAGTDRIEIIMPDDPPRGINEVLFQYKSANTPEYRPEGGVRLGSGQTHTINLHEIGMADPAHQTAVSRWKFRMIGVAEQDLACEALENLCPPTFVLPTSDAAMDLVINAYKGTEDQLDPPHPDFWGAKKVITFDPVTADVTNPTFQTPLLRERHAQLTDISLRPGKLVPMGTERVEIKVDWRADGTNPPMPDGFYMKLKFHGSNDTTYYSPDEQTCGTPPTSCTYTVYNYVNGDPRGLEDPPYEANSYWRFQLIPTVPDPQGGEIENAGVFSGTYTITATAHKLEGFVLV